MVKGPNTLNCLYSNLIKFWSYEVALVRDIGKAYHFIKTVLIEKHTRRYWFRFSKNEDCKVYGAQTVMFGDRPVVGLMTCAMERAQNH